jgi:hypothetical protein
MFRHFKERDRERYVLLCAIIARVGYAQCEIIQCEQYI